MRQEAGQSAPSGQDGPLVGAGPAGTRLPYWTFCLAFDCRCPSCSPHFFEIKPQKSAPPVAGRSAKAVETVQALASPGGEIALGHALLFDKPCSNHRVMSPSLCGSDPYPCGSLTYRTQYAVVILNISETPGFVNPGFVNFLQTAPQPSNAAISAKNCRPYRSALLAPTPLTA